MRFGRRLYILLVLNLPEAAEWLFLQYKKLNLKKFKKILFWVLGSLLFLILALYIFIQTPFGQNWIVRLVTKRLSKDLKTEISIKHVDFSLFNRMHLQGMLVRDLDKDTLLYAGSVNVRITDWFFFKKKAELKYVGLEDATIKFQRTKDSVWSQQFLFDYFSSPAASTPQAKKEGISFDLKRLEMKNVRFIKKDAWLGDDMTVRIASLKLDANEINFSGKKVDITSLDIGEPFIHISKYSRLKTRVEAVTIGNESAETIDSLLQWNAAGWVVHLDKFTINNGTFKNDKATDRPAFTYFDGQHLEFSKINATFADVTWIKDTITSKMSLETKERSGFEVKKFLANAKFTPQEMAFDGLEIVTNNSTIRNYFRMSYDDFGSMNNFLQEVYMQGNFENSEIDSDDIAYFAPTMARWKKKIVLKGVVRGTVSDLVGRNLVLQAGNNTLLNGDITLTGLPDINQTFIDFRANDFRTNYLDAVTMIPAIRKVTNPDLRKIGYVRFTGSFTGFIRDFVTFGTIETNLGVVKSDLNMKLPAGRQPVYSGSISTDNFRLGEFINNPELGALSMEAEIKGSGINDKNRNADIKGLVRFIDFNEYRYHNITLDGKLNKKLFDGVASIKDENAELTLNGKVDFNNPTPVFNFIADVKKANLKKLYLTDNDLAFNGKFNLDFEGASIDEFLGAARISDAVLTKDGTRLPFDSLILTSAYINNEKVLTARSNEFEGTIRGQFSIRDLPNGFQLFLSKYYPAYIRPPRTTPANQSFSFDITTQFVDDYVRIADSTLSGFNYSHIQGSLDMNNNALSVQADIPQFKYKQYNFDDVVLIARGDLDSVSLSGTAKNININDSLKVPEAVFSVRGRNDSSRVSITTGASQGVDKADLNALVLTYDDGVTIEFEPSDFIVNGKTWTIDENGELIFRKNAYTSGRLLLREGQQEIRVETTPQSDDLLVQLRNVNLGDISPYIMPRNRLEGLISGNVTVQSPTDSLKIISNDIETKYLRIDDDSLGEVKANVVYDGLSKRLTVNGQTANEENFLGFKADLSLGNKEAQKNNIISLTSRNFQLSIMERFLCNLFSDITGFLTGQFDIKGGFDHLSVIGKGRMHDAGLRINFTKVFYYIDDTDIELKPTAINLDGIVLKDSATRNPIYVEGGITHDAFQDMFYNINVSTRRKGTTGTQFNRPVTLLNTTYADNQQFYGRVKGTGSFTLTGPQSEMFMGISAIASTEDSSYITIPPSKSRESGKSDFLVERKYGREMSDSGLNNAANNIIYDVDITANPMLNVRVQLDDLTGDQIKGRGRGTLNIHSGTSEPLRMRGRFDIEEGDYLFTFQSFFKKPFELRTGGENFIEWTDDPYDARINFDAIYTADDVSFAPLVNSLQDVGISSNLSRARGDVYVVANLSGKLFEPEILFSLDFPNTSPAKSDPGLGFTLRELSENVNEVNKQVTYLIVFNSFAPIEGGSASSSGLDFSGIATSTISGIFLGVINDQLNKILSKLVNNEKYLINLNTSIYNRNIIDPDNKTALNLSSNINFSIGRSFFNNRFIITAGGGFDAPLQQGDIQQSIQLLPDVTMEWLINESGTIRATFFYRQDADYLTSNAGNPGRAKRYGGSLTYRREFNKLSQLFKSKKKEKEKEIPPAGTAADVPPANKKEEEEKKNN